MNDSITQFRTNINQVKNLAGIYSALEQSTTQVLDLSDILRAEMVMAVSTLDYFIHGTVEEGMIEIYQGTRPKTEAYEDFEISLSNVPIVIVNPQDTIWLKDQIRKNLGHLSFQKSEKISNILKLITDKKIWFEVSTILNKPQSDIILKLDLIVNRRNQIAHQADMDPTYPNRRWPINEMLVNDAIQHIDDVCESIFQIVK